jgi:hypothetical protein
LNSALGQPGSSGKTLSRGLSLMDRTRLPVSTNISEIRGPQQAKTIVC